MTPAAELRCATYARYSTDKQNPLSIADQVRKCQQFAEKQAWRFLNGHVYSDEAVSGATDSRSGLARLIEAATSTPRPFDVILIDDSSRLSRNLVDSLRIFEQMHFAHVRMIFISQGIDSDSEQARVLFGIHGIVDSLYIEELAKKVFRGMEGRALAKLHTGGRCFGYKNVPIEDSTRTDNYGRPIILGVRLAVDESQAEIVRRIFALYAKGLSLKGIAKRLNLEGVPSPQPQAGRISRSWCPSSIRTILRNQRYRGRVVWGMKRKVRSPKTGKKIAEWRPENEWTVTEIPEQRIVPEESWTAVRERMALVQRVFGRGTERTGLMRARAASSPYIFSGLMKCSVCGANISVVSGRWRKRKDVVYGCPMNANRGCTVCPNNVRIQRNVLETQMLAGLQEKVLHPEVIEYTLRRFEEALSKQMGALDSELEQVLRKKTNLEKEILNLTDRIATGDPSASIMVAIANRERELSWIADLVLECRPDSLRVRLEGTRSFAETRLRDLRCLLNIDPATIRSEIAKHVRHIVLTPVGKTYRATGTWDLLGCGSMGGAGGQNRTAYASLFRAALYQ
jgi:site-specific DNA recombinase